MQPWNPNSNIAKGGCFDLGQGLGWTADGLPIPAALPSFARLTAGGGRPCVYSCLGAFLFAGGRSKWWQQYL